MENTKKSGRILGYSGIFAFILVFTDQITKLLAVRFLKGKAPFVVIKNVFELRYLENESAAFSLDPVSLLQKLFHFSYFESHPDAFLRCKMGFFVVLTGTVLVILIYIYRKIPWNRHFLPVNLIMIGFFSGALGNLADRIRCQYVIDFFYFSLIDFPVFNVADIYVTLAAAGLVIVLFRCKDEDFEMIFPSKNKQKQKE